MSKLVVDTIEGKTGTTVTLSSGQTLAASGTTISGGPTLSGTSTIATGGKIAGTDTGSIYAPGVPIQVKYYSTAAHLAITSTNFTGIIIDNCTITPKFSSSKILVKAFVNCNHDNNYSGLIRVYRDGSPIGDNGADQGNMWSHVWFNVRSVSTEMLTNCSAEYLDSPATTNQITYQIRGMTTGDTEGLCINRTRADGNHANSSPAFSGLTLMEIAQ